MRSAGRLATLVAAVTLPVAIASSGLAAAGPSIPSRAGSLPTAPTVKAVVVSSWGNCTSKHLIWNSLNATWASYGTTPIAIDYADPALCSPNRSFTLADLEASQADVVILSDAAVVHHFSLDEVDALQHYDESGHDLIGTFLTFKASFDNTAIAPLFGLAQDRGWALSGGVVPTYHLREVKHPRMVTTLFRGLPNPYVSRGYASAELPADGQWSHNDLAGAKVVASNATRTAAITVFERGTYRAIFVATMPEYVGGTQDKQLMYNAIVYPSSG